MPETIQSKLSRWFKETGALPFMIGLFVGCLTFNPDLIFNVFVTVLGGGSWQMVRLFTIGH